MFLFVNWTEWGVSQLDINMSNHVSLRWLFVFKNYYIEEIRQLVVHFIQCVDLLHITGLGHANTLGLHHNNAENTSAKNTAGSDILDRKSYDLKLEKSNILLLGPTGSGNFRNNISNGWVRI